MVEEYRTGKKLPSRKELRLARQAAQLQTQEALCLASKNSLTETDINETGTESALGTGKTELQSVPLDVFAKKPAEQMIPASAPESSPNPILPESSPVKVASESSVHTVKPARRGAHKVQKVSEDATESIPAVGLSRLDNEAQCDAFNAKFAPAKVEKISFLKQMIRKSPELSAVVFATVLVGVSLGVIGLQNAEGDEKFVPSESVLNSVSLEDRAASSDEINALKPTKGSAELAKIIETQIAANSGQLRCTDETGANTLNSAYAEKYVSQVFFPMKAGTYRVSSPFGNRVNPTGSGIEFHTGVDFAASNGTPIYAVADGVVVMDGSETAGNHDIRIKHEINGQVFYTWYLHSYEDGIFVKVGQKVKAGEKIAEVGSSGRSTGPHLHFEIRPVADYSQEPVEPVAFISKLGATDITQKCE